MTGQILKGAKPADLPSCSRPGSSSSFAYRAVPTAVQNLTHLDRELRPAVLRRRSRALISGDYCRLASLFLSNTASTGPSDTMLPRRLTVGEYKFETLPPSRNRAFGHFSASRNRRAKESNDTSP